MGSLSREEFEEKYHLYSKDLMNVSFGYTRDKDASLDVIQNVFLKFFNSNKTFSTIVEEKFWLIRVTINESKDYLRKNKRITNVDEDIIDSFYEKDEPKEDLRLKKLSIKVSIDEFLNNLKYYVFDFGMGLSSTILNSMDSSENDNLIDVSLVLTNYEENSNAYNIGLNIGELTGISGIEDLNIKIESKEVLYNDLYVLALTSINSLSLKMFSVLEIKLNEAISLKNLDYDNDNNLMFTDVLMEDEMNYINSYIGEIGEILYS